MSFLCAIPVLANLFAACSGTSGMLPGYVEGEYVYVAPIEVAPIERLHVRRGDRVTAGDLLVEMEARDAEAAVARAEAALAAAESRLADLRAGARPEEIAQAEAALKSAEAQAREAQRELQRKRDLFERGVLSQAELELAETRAATAEAKVAELQARLEVTRLPARPDQIRAAEAAVREARAALRQALWRLEKRRLLAPETGTLADIVRYEGEIAGPQAPVVSILPVAGVKLKLYVPEPLLSDWVPGRLLDVACDGCPPGQRARISYVSDHPEFTPPVIFSREVRQKLVYLVEALPEEGATALKPGQIVDARLAEVE